MIRKNDVCLLIDKKAEKFQKLSEEIWNYAELGLREFKSAGRQCEILEEQGFLVTKNLAGMPTAFEGRWGCQKPVIAILGEFDALPGLSQKAALAKQEPVEEGGCGHGCGHNLLGAGSMAAAVAVKDYLQKNDIKGTIVYFGCPGEEKGSGKTFMARAGCFNSVDAALCWHPGDANFVMNTSSLAALCTYFRFYGTTAHAAASPHLGRSALDAVELMNVGCNYLREHIIPEARVHYAITNPGSRAPNVVPDFAEVFYEARAPKLSDAFAVLERMCDVARGAALMTGTRCEIARGDGYSDYIPNRILGGLLQKNLEQVGAPPFSSEELRFAEAIRETLPGSALESALAFIRKQTDEDTANRLKGRAAADIIAPFPQNGGVLPGSTDVGDVSYVTPTGQIFIACKALGTPDHSWQQVSQSGSSLGQTGMITAAKILALTALDLIVCPCLLKEAREEFFSGGGGEYHCPIPSGVEPEL